jgi:hypothetical protein
MSVSFPRRHGRPPFSDDRQEPHPGVTPWSGSWVNAAPGRLVVDLQVVHDPAHIDAGNDHRRCGTVPSVSSPHDDAGVTTDGNTGRYPNLGPAWKAGQSGNLAGRSLSLVNLAWEARRATDGGRELIRLQVAIARGEEIPIPGRARGQRPTIDQRQQAIEWLANRAFGKAKEIIEIAGEPSPAQRLELLRRLTEGERRELRGLLQRALNPGPSAPASDTPDEVPGVPATTPLEETDSGLPPSDPSHDTPSN